MIERLIFLLLALFLSAALPAQAKTWHVAETDNFRVYSGGSVKKLEKLAGNLESFDMLLRAITGLKRDPPPDKFNIYMVKKQSDLVDYTKLSNDTAGYYSARPTASAAFSQRGGKTSGDTSKTWRFTSQQVLFHEYAHHFMLRYFPYAYPAWYVEGFAEYVSTAQFKEKAIILGDFSRGRAYTLVNEGWLPMETLLSPMKPRLSRQDTYKFYAQSWFLTHYMLRDGERMAALTDFLGRYSTPETLHDDFEASFGMTLDDLQTKLRRYMKGRGEKMTLTTYKLNERNKAEMRITKLPASAEDALLLAVKLELGVNKSFQQDALEKADALKMDYPDDLLAQRTWALAQISFGDRAAGQERLTELATLHRDDAKIPFYLGMSYYLDARSQAEKEEPSADTRKKAKAYFAKAFRLDKTHYPTLYYYYRSSRFPLSPSDEAALEEAAYLAPQVDEIRFAQADMWARREDEKYKTGAIRIFKSLANDPHGGALAQAAAERYQAMTATSP